MQIVLSAAALLAAWVLLWLRVEPVPTWFYVFAWYPTLALFDGLVVRRGGASLLRRPGVVVSLFAWSAVIWLVFEAFNFRVQNWYYVFLPRAGLERWAGILLSFATVVPAVLLAERALASLGLGTRWVGRPTRHGLPHVDHFIWIGVALVGLVLWLPAWFYPLVWGAVFLVADPIVYRRRPDLSLIADLERGDWGRIGRLFLAGLVVGGLWETYNHWARGKWIYTVPLLENLKWFEMPPLGFVGFPFFALEAWAVYQMLVVLGVAEPITAGDHGRRGATRGDETTAGDVRAGADVARRRLSSAIVALLATLFAIATLIGMERWTISSTVPGLGIGPGALGGVRTVWELAAVEPSELAARAGLPADSARHLVDRARVATLRGIGTGHAYALARVNRRTVCDIADADAHNLWAHLHALNPQLGRRPTEAEVRVWVRAAHRACYL